MSGLIAAFHRYMADRGYRLDDPIPDFVALPAMLPLPTDGSVVVFTSMPNEHGWKMPEQYRTDHVDTLLVEHAMGRLGAIAGSPFIGRLELRDYEHDNPALRGVDYIRAVVMVPSL